MRVILLALLLAWPAAAQEVAERAVVRPESAVTVRGGDAEIILRLSRAVPWSVSLQDDPWRLAIDLREGDFSAFAPGDLGEGIRWGRVGPGRTRLVVPLRGPMGIAEAGMETGEAGATIRVALDADVPPVLTGAEADPPVILRREDRVQDGSLVVALDPGHGGIDPGARRGAAQEAALMLSFARELAEVLRRAGHEVVLTREADELVSLRGRASVARAAGADLMISLHADAVAGGGASGATVYTLAPGRVDRITEELAQRQARDDLLLGVELDGEGDEIAHVLIDLARAETAPRADALADALVAGLTEAGLRLHKRPRLGAQFTVLKTPDIPTVLLELGFMSDPRDLENLLNADWRARMAQAVARSIEAWAVSDAALAERRRR